MAGRRGEHERQWGDQRRETWGGARARGALGDDRVRPKHGGRRRPPGRSRGGRCTRSWAGTAAARPRWCAACSASRSPARGRRGSSGKTPSATARADGAGRRHTRGAQRAAVLVEPRARRLLPAALPDLARPGVLRPARALGHRPQAPFRPALARPKAWSTWRSPWPPSPSC